VVNAPMEPRPAKAPGSPTSPMLRQVGESYKDYAARMYGWARAASADRDAALAESKQLRDEIGQERQRRTLGGPPPRPVPPDVWRSGPSTPPATAPEET
jgi:hypothetical protein